MGGEVLAILFIVAVMTAFTKSGRNFIRSAHQATGWRTPRKAAQHHSGRLGGLTGRGIAAGTRGSGKAAKFAGRGAVSGIGRLGKNRRPLIPLMWRGDPRDTENNGSGGSAPQAANATPVKVTDPGRRTPRQGAPGSPLAPVPGPDNSGTGTDPAPVNPQVTAPAGAQQRRTNMTQRYTLNLEPPTTDGEFLETITQIADVLKSLAEQLGEWAADLGARKLPSSVTNPLQQVSEGIKEAATGASQSAKAFEDEFEDAREVAARGMHFTGQDAA
jgi:hypothetical protein